MLLPLYRTWRPLIFAAIVVRNRIIHSLLLICIAAHVTVGTTSPRFCHVGNVVGEPEVPISLVLSMSTFSPFVCSSLLCRSQHPPRQRYPSSSTLSILVHVLRTFASAASAAAIGAPLAGMVANLGARN